jgi:GAF domain-containing protein
MMERVASQPYFVALFEAAKAVHSSLVLQDVLQEIVRSSADALGAKAAALRLLKPGTSTLVLCAAHGLSSDYLRKGPVAVDGSELDRQVLQGRPVVVPDASRDARFQYPAEAAGEGIRSVLCVPLMLDGRGIGVLRVYSGAPRAFDGGEVDLLTAMATLGAIAIRNAEDYKQVRDDLRHLQEFVARPW